MTGRISRTFYRSVELSPRIRHRVLRVLDVAVWVSITSPGCGWFRLFGKGLAFIDTNDKKYVRPMMEANTSSWIIIRRALGPRRKFAIGKWTIEYLI